MKLPNPYRATDVYYRGLRWLGGSAPQTPLWHVPVLYPSPLHQGISVSSGGRSQLTQNPYARKSQMFTTVASGGWELRLPDPPYGMCLSCNQVLARPGLHIGSGTSREAGPEH